MELAFFGPHFGNVDVEESRSGNTNRPKF